MAHFFQAILLGALAYTLLFSEAAAAGDRVCQISARVGPDAVVLRGDGEVDAVPDLSLSATDAIKTGTASQVEIVCSDDILITVGTTTEITLGTLLGTPEEQSNIVMRLVAGIAGFVAPQGSWNTFRVRGPSAIASVRSTEWLVDISDGATSIFVEEGAVFVETINPDSGAVSELTTLTVGEGVDVSSSGQPDSVKVWGEARVQDAQSRLGLSWDQ